MGVLGDSIEEFKKAKTPEKVFIIGGGLAVLAIALYIHNQQSGSSTPAQGATGASLSGSGTSGGGGGIQTVPTGNGGNVPILPPGLTPIFDGSGNLLGYQPTPPTSTGGGTSGGGGTTNPPTAFNPRAPQLPFGTNVPSKLGSLFTYNGTTYTIVPGPNGIIYGAVGKMSASQAQNTPIGTQKYVLTAPQSHYTNIKQGGGPYGTRVLGVHRGRIAPSVEGRPQYTQATMIYSLRNR